MDATIFEALCSPLVVATIGFISMLIGGLVGHRLTYWRDRRKEFADAVQPIRARLIKDRSHNHYSLLSSVEIDLLNRLLPFRKRRGFRAAVASYETSINDNTAQDSIGGMTYAKTEPIDTGFKVLLRYTHWR